MPRLFPGRAGGSLVHEIVEGEEEEEEEEE